MCSRWLTIKHFIYLFSTALWDTKGLMVIRTISLTKYKIIYTTILINNKCLKFVVGGLDWWQDLHAYRYSMYIYICICMCMYVYIHLHVVLHNIKAVDNKAANRDMNYTGIKACSACTLKVGMTPQHLWFSKNRGGVTAALIITPTDCHFLLAPLMVLL